MSRPVPLSFTFTLYFVTSFMMSYINMFSPTRDGFIEWAIGQFRKRLASVIVAKAGHVEQLLSTVDML